MGDADALEREEKGTAAGVGVRCRLDYLKDGSIPELFAVEAVAPVGRLAVVDDGQATRPVLLRQLYAHVVQHQVREGGLAQVDRGQVGSGGGSRGAG